MTIGLSDGHNFNIMIIKDIEKYSNIYGKVDAFIMVNRDNIIQYSAMVNDDRTVLNTKNVIGKNLFEMYPNLTEENSTHCRVMKTGKPIIDENQLIVEKSGKAYVIKTSTFPIFCDGEIIGTFDISSNLTLKNTRDQEERSDRRYTLESIVTQNEEMLRIKNKISKVAKNDSPVMVIGESGTGKELIVEAIHTSSTRNSKPFISLNCAAIPESLMESILFGTVKGSFTGAENRKGIFELADGGTLFLDEINSMNPDLQAKLLRVIEEQRYMKIGGEKYINVDVRVISAMNVSPEKAIKSKALREDLFYRLGVIQIYVPPLRERKGDISVLIEHFVELYNKKMGKDVESVEPKVLELFYNYSWPGNVRELKNVMESSFNMVEDHQIKLADIPEYLHGHQYAELREELSPNVGLAEMMAEYEKEILIKTLKEVETLTEASSVLKMTRQAIKYKIEKYNIDYKGLLKL